MMLTIALVPGRQLAWRSLASPCALSLPHRLGSFLARDPVHIFLSHIAWQVFYRVRLQSPHQSRVCVRVNFRACLAPLAACCRVFCVQLCAHDSGVHVRSLLGLGLFPGTLLLRGGRLSGPAAHDINFACCGCSVRK